MEIDNIPVVEVYREMEGWNVWLTAGRTGAKGSC